MRFFSRGTLFSKAITPSVVFLALACRVASDPTLLAELRNESELRGFALVTARGSDIAVIPFGSKPRYFDAGPRQPQVFGKAGKDVLWSHQTGFLTPREYGIETVMGDKVIRQRPLTSQFVPMALSESAGRLAFWGTMRSGDPIGGLYWASFDFAHHGFVDQTGGNCDWSPDGGSLAYEKGGEIYVFEVERGMSRHLISGRDPVWSPDGAAIAYRGSDDSALLVSVEGVKKAWALSGYKALSAIRWSPDGRYVSFAVSTRPVIPLVGSYYRLLVCRVEDGRAAMVREFGAGAVGTGNYHWIADYTRYCTGCQPGQEF